MYRMGELLSNGAAGALMPDQTVPVGPYPSEGLCFRRVSVMFQWWKSKDVEDRIFQHFNLVERALLKCEEALEKYLEGDLEQADAFAVEAGALEGEADDVRRNVESMLLRGAMLPESLQDLWEIIERIDKLADVGEAMLDFALLQRVEIPAAIRSTIEDVFEKSVETLQELKSALQVLFQDLGRVPEHTRRIEELEHEVDTLEREAIRELFSSDVELARKVQVREFITILTDISDRAEDVSDLLELAVARRAL